MNSSQQFGEQMSREAKRRRFDEAPRKAYVADGLTCNWRIHRKHFADYTPVLDFVHAAGAEAILQIRSAALSDDDRLVRILTHRPGNAKIRRLELTSPDMHPG